MLGVLTLAANKSKSRPSVSKILEGQNWERKEYRHLSPNDITELVGSYIGVPKMVADVLLSYLE